MNGENGKKEKKLATLFNMSESSIYINNMLLVFK